MRSLDFGIADDDLSPFLDETLGDGGANAPRPQSGQQPVPLVFQPSLGSSLVVPEQNAPLAPYRSMRALRPLEQRILITLGQDSFSRQSGSL